MTFQSKNRTLSLQHFLVKRGLKKSKGGRSPSRAAKQLIRNWRHPAYKEAVLKWLGRTEVNLPIPPHGKLPKIPKGYRWASLIKASELYLFSLELQNCVGWLYLHEYNNVKLPLSCLIDGNGNLVAVLDLEEYQCQFREKALKPGLKKWLRKVIDKLSDEIEDLRGPGYSPPQSNAGIKLAKALWPRIYRLQRLMRRRYEVFF